MTRAGESPWTQVFGFSVLDHVPVGCCVLNSQMEVVFWNKVLERWTDIDRWDILYQPVTSFFPNLKNPHYRVRFQGVFRGGPPLILSSHLHGQIFPSLCADGRSRLQHTTVTSIPSHDGTGCLACLAVEDVSEVTRRIADLRETRDQARNLAAEARQAYEVKSQFLATMSHELRTPLNSILLLSRVLMENKEGRFNEADTTSLGIVNQSGRALLQLVDDILDLSKVEAGKGSVVLEQVDLRPLVDDLLREVGPLLTHKGLELQCRFADRVPDRIVTDQQAVTRILRNLLSNAAKFAETGTVHLRAELQSPGWLEEDRDGQRWLALSVQDQGPGISREKHGVVFEPFCQEDQTISRRFGGTGLGLSISRQLAELLGGRLILNSEPGQGATFTLFLPLEGSASAGGDAAKGIPPARALPLDAEEEVLPELPPQKCPGEETPLASDHLDGRTVLLAGDDMRDVFTLSGALERVQAKVLTARSFAAARDVLNSGLEIDLLIMNISGCPSQDDEKAVAEIRRQVQSLDLPVVCTAWQQSGDGESICEKCLVARRVDRQELLTRPVATIECALLQKT